jgi:hypothetical protein
MTLPIRIIAVVFALAASAQVAAAASFTGVVKTVSGAPVVVRAGTLKPITRGMFVEKGDRLRTGPAEAVGVVFADDTRLSLGPNAELVLEDYLFDPAAKQLSFVARVIQGTIGYISGQIAKLSPKSVRLLMPTATIGVRGTSVLVSVH